MSDDVLKHLDPRELGSRLREARAASGWTQEKAADRIGVARTTMTAIEKGERRIRPVELTELAALYGRKLSNLLRRGAAVGAFSVQLRGAVPSRLPADLDLLPARYRYIALEAWQQGQLSEGQLAAFLRVDRLQARRTVQELRRVPGIGEPNDARLDLGSPLFSTG